MKSNLLWSAFIMCAMTGSAMAQNDHVSNFTTADGKQVTLTSGQPAPQSYGARPSFEQLDTDHDGFISRAEAHEYMPLYNDFDHLTHGDRISKAQYNAWDYR